MGIKSGIASIVTFIVLTSIFHTSCSENQQESTPEKDTLPKYEPRIEYGFLLDTFNVVQDKIKSGMTLSHLFSPYGISQQKINVADQLGRDSAGLKFITEGNKYTVLRNKKDSSQTYYCIYEKNRVEYIIFDFRDSVNVTLVKRPVTITQKEIGGEIAKNSNLVFTIKDQLGDDAVAGELAESIAQIFAWTIDFFKLYPGDKFKVIYEEKQVEGEPYGIGEIKAVYFFNISAEYYAFRYTQNGEVGYWDQNGKGMKRPFLKAPLKFSRMTSGYTMRRFHPVQKIYKAHLGTDYAAPTGTPIMATADGTVESAGYTSGNGNFVKLYHNKTYQTAYLHMSKIEGGMHKGIKVKQGQIIGYVGSTGLATGPHVCYRFWKNGQQVDPRAEKFQATEPIKETELAAFKEHINPLLQKLDSIKITPAKEVAPEPENDSLQ